MSESSSGVSQPHDRFFKFLFSDQEKVCSFLQGCLPQEVLDRLDLTQLKTDSNSYVDEQLQESYADLVFRCPYGQEEEVHLVFLLEHKSFVPAYPHLQLLRYLLNLWEQQIARKEPLQAVIPIILYHGQQNWVSRPFSAYLSVDEPVLRPYLPEFAYVLVNLTADDKEAIRSRYGNFYLQKGLLLMKYILDQQLIEELDVIFGNFLQDENREQGKEIFRTFSLYISSIPKQKKQGIMEKIEDLIKDWGYEEGSLDSERDTQGREQGIEQGIEQGMEKMTKEGIIKMLQLGYEYQVIATVFSVGIDRVQQIEQDME